MTDARDPLRLMDAQHVDPALRAALRQVSQGQPDAAEVAALVERVGDALSGSAGSASWFSQFVSHGSGFKWMALLVAGGATVWGAAKTLPLAVRPEVSAVAPHEPHEPHELERAVEQVIVDSTRSARVPDRVSAAATTVAEQALPTVEVPRGEAASVAPRRDAPARVYALPGSEGREVSLTRSGARVSSSSPARRSAARPLPSPPPKGEGIHPSPPPKGEGIHPSAPPKGEGTEEREAPVGEESELALITRAQSALKLAPRRALELLDRHDALYPSGHFAEEREVLWIDALSQLGMRHALAARGERFLASYPSSIHCARVRTLLAAARPPR